MIPAMDTKINVAHNAFVDNNATGSSLIYTYGGRIIIFLNEFISNKASGALVEVQYYTKAESLTNNVFINNSAAYEVYISTTCRPGLSQ